MQHCASVLIGRQLHKISSGASCSKWHNFSSGTSGTSFHRAQVAHRATLNVQTIHALWEPSAARSRSERATLGSRKLTVFPICLTAVRDLGFSSPFLE